MRRTICLLKQPLVTVFTKKYCGLCSHVLEELEEMQMQEKVQFRVEQIDIEEKANLQWKKKYHLDIPVIHINGIPAMKHGIDIGLFKNMIDDANQE